MGSKANKTDPSVAPAPMSRRRWVVILAVVALVLFASVAFRDVLSFEVLRDNREALLTFRDAHFGAAALLFMLAYVVVVAFSLPGATLATLTGGFLFGSVWGSLFNMSAATLGATLLFLAARYGVGRHWGARLDAADGLVKRIKAGVDQNQWSMLFLIRLMPIVPFFLANLVPAFMNVPLHRFVISTFLGILPGAVVYTSVGAGLGTVFEQGTTPDLGLIFAPQILWPLIGLIALAALPILYNTVARQTSRKKEPRA